MKKFGLALFALALLTTLSAKCSKEQKEDCHKAVFLHNGQLIEVAPNAAQAHLDHGDEFIECIPKN